MKRLQRAVIAIMCVVCLAFGMIACGDDNKPSGDKATYTVTVKAGSGVTGTTMRGVTVKLLNTADGTDAAAAKELTLNADRTQGTAKFSLKKGNYTVDIGNIPGLYVNGSVTLTSTVTKTTVTITDQAPPAPTVEYKVLFKLPDGTPVANTSVQICGGANGQCYPATTDANGWATWNQPAGDYEVHVPSAGWPTGYYFDDSAFKLTASVNSLNVEFRALVSHTVTFKYATNYDHSYYGYYDAGDPAVNVSFDIYAHSNAYGGQAVGEKFATVTTDENGVATFTAPEICRFENIVDPNGCVLGDEGSRVLESQYSREVVLHKPGMCNSAPIKFTLDKAETVSYTADGALVWFEFPNKKSGVYTLSSAGTDGVAKTVKMFDKSGSVVNLGYDLIAVAKETPEKVDIIFTEENNNFTVEIPLSNAYASESGLGSNLFAIGVDSADEAGTFTVTLTRTGDYVEPVLPEEVDVEPKQMFAKEDLPAIPDESKFVFLADGYYTDDQLVKGSDGIYRLKANEQIIYASFGDKYSSPSVFINGGGFNQAVLESGGIGFIFSDQKTYNNNYLEFVKAYIAGSNADGLHPLNDEIKDFLVLYSKGQGKADLTYQYATGYYAPKYTEVAVTEGVGQIPEFGDFKVEVPANSTVAIANMVPVRPFGYQESAITLITDNASIKLSATEDGAAVKKVVVDGGAKFYIKNESAQAVSVKFNAFYDTADENITAVGTYVLKALPGNDAVTYKFTVPEDGVYTFDYDDDTYGWSIADEVEGLSYQTVAQLKRGTELKISVVPNDNWCEPIAEITIAKVDVVTSLSVGANQVYVNAAERTSFVFTAPAADTYSFACDKGVFMSADKDGKQEISEPVELEAGAEYTVWRYTYNPVLCTLTVSDSNAPPPPSTLTGGETIELGQTYIVSASPDGTTYTFTADEDGTYVVSVPKSDTADEPVAYITFEAGMAVETVSDIDGTITLKAGTTYTVTCSPYSWDVTDTITFTLTITKQA